MNHQTSNPEDYITPLAIEMAFENTNFGEMKPSEVLYKNLRSVSNGYHIGFTAGCILRELSLVHGMGMSEPLRITKLGKLYLLALERKKELEMNE